MFACTFVVCIKLLLDLTWLDDRIKTCLRRIDIFIQICAVGSKRRIFSTPECVLAFQGHPIESTYVASYYSIIMTMVYWSYLEFLSYCDLLAKNCLFFLPLSHSAPSFPMFPSEFCGKVNREETRVTGLFYSEDRMIVAWVVLTQSQRVTDRRADGRTDGFTMASTASDGEYFKIHVFKIVF